MCSEEPPLAAPENMNHTSFFFSFCKLVWASPTRTPCSAAPSESLTAAFASADGICRSYVWVLM